MGAYFYDTLIGKILLQDGPAGIERLYFDGGIRPRELPLEETPLLQEAARQLSAYLAGKRKAFELPLAPDGTLFQRNVWQVLRTIPYGETLSYGEVAELAGVSRGAQAVGMACRQNPIPLFIPCHRVVGADGALTGFAGGLPLKCRLLELERLHA